jgi:malonyl-CoA/methylmalonyl-CoA synthetase
VMIHDVGADIQATAGHYLSDILNLRNVMFAKLNVDAQRKLLLGGPVYICLMAQGGYEFSVAILAILALGAAAVPMGEFITLSMSKGPTTDIVFSCLGNFEGDCLL